MRGLPLPVIHRLSYVYDIAGRLERQGINRISSAELGRYLGQTAHTIRKDVHCLGIAGAAGAKYETGELRKLIAEHLGFNRPKRCCIVGLGRLGSAILEHALASDRETFEMVAGFDSNVNRIEVLQTSVALYPAYQIAEKVKQLNIELAFVAVPAHEAQDVADRCCDGGVSGLLNFTSAMLQPKYGHVVIRTVDITGELRILSALAFVHTNRPE